MIESLDDPRVADEEQVKGGRASSGGAAGGVVSEGQGYGILMGR